MRYERKKVTYRALKKGQEIQGWTSGGITHGANAIVADINPAYVTILMWGTREEKVPSEGSTFEIEMSEEEFNEKYKEGAKAVMKGLQNKLAEYEIGYHEMWNSWIRYNPFEMAKACKEDGMTVLGVCYDVWKHYDDSDVGICVEDHDGVKFWCHADGDFVKKMREEYDYLIK